MESNEQPPKSTNPFRIPVSAVLALLFLYYIARILRGFMFDDITLVGEGVIYGAWWGYCLYAVWNYWK